MITETRVPAQKASVDQGYSDQQLSAYYQELERLLERVEHSSTLYEVLGLDRRTNTGEIKLAYTRAAALLNPSQFELNLSVPDGSLLRVDDAFEKVSRAFAVLVSFSRRCQYDESLRQERTAEPPSSKSDSTSSDCRVPGVAAAPESDAISITPARSQPREFASPASDAALTDRRKCERFKLSIPVLVTGYERGKGKWTELTQTIDISRMGVMIRLAKRVRNGRVLHLTMPMPAELRTRGHGEPRYGVYAVVRRVEPFTDGRRGVGLELLGEEPPPGYVDEPTQNFDHREWDNTQRRRSPREERVEEVIIDYLSQTMELLGREETFTENVSSFGMRVMSEAAPADFELVRVRCSRRGFESLAAVSNQYIGNDGVARLCLRLLDNTWPA